VLVGATTGGREKKNCYGGFGRGSGDGRKTVLRMYVCIYTYTRVGAAAAAAAAVVDDPRFDSEQQQQQQQSGDD